MIQQKKCSSDTSLSMTAKRHQSIDLDLRKKRLGLLQKAEACIYHPRAQYTREERFLLRKISLTPWKPSICKRISPLSPLSIIGLYQAGAMLAYSCRYIATSKDGSMGAAEPVIMGEGGQMQSASEKIILPSAPILPTEPLLRQKSLHCPSDGRQRSHPRHAPWENHPLG